MIWMKNNPVSGLPSSHPDFPLIFPRASVGKHHGIGDASEEDHRSNELEPAVTGWKTIPQNGSDERHAEQTHSRQRMYF